MPSESDLKQLRKKIDSVGAPDSFIDQDEETDVIDAGASLGLDSAAIESLINQMCRRGGWTREKDIIDDVYDVLKEATADDGVIDQKEFEHCVGYAVSMNMPRKRALALAVRFIQDEGLSVKKTGLLFSKDWFSPLKEQYGRD
jgi:hypothetical protein